MGDTSFRPSDASTYDQDLSKDYAAELENEMTKGAPRPRDVQADVKEMMKTFEKDKHNEFEKMIKEGQHMPLKQRPSEKMRESTQFDDL